MHLLYSRKIDAIFSYCFRFPFYVHFLSIILTFPPYIPNQGDEDNLESIPCSTMIALLYKEDSI